MKYKMRRNIVDRMMNTDCACGWLERHAADLNCPVVFKENFNEYQLSWEKGPNGVSSALFYYCPFCGGKAPKSIRDSYFYSLTPDDVKRLNELTAGLKTIDEVKAKFGEPSSESWGRARENPENGTGELTVRSQIIVYDSISEVAYVQAMSLPGRELEFTYTPKPKGKE